MRPAALQYAVDIIAPTISQDPGIGQVIATRLLSTDPRAEDVWAAIKGGEKAPKAADLDGAVPLVSSSWRQLLPQLQRAHKERSNANDAG